MDLAPLLDDFLFDRNLFDVTGKNGAKQGCLAFQCLHVQNFKAVLILLEIFDEVLQDFEVAVVAGIVKHGPEMAFLTHLFRSGVPLLR